MIHQHADLIFYIAAFITELYCLAVGVLIFAAYCGQFEDDAEGTILHPVVEFMNRPRFKETS